MRCKPLLDLSKSDKERMNIADHNQGLQLISGMECAKLHDLSLSLAKSRERDLVCEAAAFMREQGKTLEAIGMRFGVCIIGPREAW